MSHMVSDLKRFQTWTESREKQLWGCVRVLSSVTKSPCLTLLSNPQVQVQQCISTPKQMLPNKEKGVHFYS